MPHESTRWRLAAFLSAQVAVDDNDQIVGRGDMTVQFERGV
jgi:hypothetical protein